MALRGKKAEATEKRLKLFLYGEAGSGKTTAAIQMPRPYVIDTEKGTEQKAYIEKINSAGGAVFRTTSDLELLEELRALMTEEHPYKTLIIDPITNIEDGIINDATSKYKALEKEGGDMRVWRDRDLTMRRIRSILLNIDMNVVITAHGKNEYEEGSVMKKKGITHEGWKKWPYIFDLVLEIHKLGNSRKAIVRKTRMAEEFPDGDQFEWSYEELSRRYNPEIMERQAAAVRLSTPEQIDQMHDLLAILKVEDGWPEKVFKAAGVECWEEMPEDKMQKCINMKLDEFGKLKSERKKDVV